MDTPADDLNEAIRLADVQDVYGRLSLLHQERFWAWIDKARDRDARERRIQIFVLSLRMGPHQPHDVSGESSDLAKDG